MKYLFTPLLVLLLCTCGRAQFDESLAPLITDHPTLANWARWELTRTNEDGSQQIWYAAYDTLPNVIEYGKVLFREGGFIGEGRVPTNDQYYTEEVRDFMKTRGLPMHHVRQAIIGNITAKGSVADNILTFDTLTNYSLVGSWDIAGNTCGLPNSTMTVEVDTASNVNGPILALIDPANSQFNYDVIGNTGLDVVHYLSVSLGEIITIVKVNDDEWRGPFGCKWTRSQQ